MDKYNMFKAIKYYTEEKINEVQLQATTLIYFSNITSLKKEVSRR